MIKSFFFNSVKQIHLWLFVFFSRRVRILSKACILITEKHPYNFEIQRNIIGRIFTNNLRFRFKIKHSTVSFKCE